MEYLERMNSLLSLCFVVFILCLPDRADSIRGDGVTGLSAINKTIGESVPDKPALPSVEETRNAIMALSKSSTEDSSPQEMRMPGCFSNGKNQCVQSPTAGVRDYLRTLAGDCLFAPSFLSKLFPLNGEYVAWGNPCV